MIESIEIVTGNVYGSVQDDQSGWIIACDLVGIEIRRKVPNFFHLKEMNVILGLTGSVATIKFEELVRLLVERGAQVQIVVTENALRFIKTMYDHQELLERMKIWTDEDEWTVQLGLL